ncbi:MAG: BON domain-containing protein [Rhizobacter sp.]
MQQATLATRAVLGVAFASIVLVGCNKPADSSTPGQVVDRTITQVEQKATEMKEQAAAGMEKAEDQAKAATQDVREAGQRAKQAVGNKVADAVITTEINAEIARDSRLSALKINVDTVEGTVSLSGSAPDAVSRARASQLASAVKGVTSVDNRLTIMPDKI